MRLMRMLRPTNRKVRILVGLLLAALFAIQCTNSVAFKQSSGVTAINGQRVGENSSQTIGDMEKLAKTDHIALLSMCLKNYQSKYRDYTCTFTKQEVIKGVTKPEQEMNVKFMGEPYSVAMAWTKNPPTGDRVLYIEGKNDNQMMVRPANTILRKLVRGSVLRQPDGAEAMNATLRPVNMFGFERSMKSLLEIYALAKKQGDLKQASGGMAKVGDRDTIVLVRDLPDKPEYASAAVKTLIYIDTDYLVPIRIEGYDSEGKPSSVYTFSNIKLNMGLKDTDFLPEANEIEQPK